MSGITTSARNIFLLSTGLSVPLWQHLAPPTLVRLIPLISSTMSLQWAIDEYQSHSTWLDPSVRKEADVDFPKWWRAWLPKGTIMLFATFPTSWGGGLANIWALRQHTSLDSANPNVWYAAGILFALGHMLWGNQAIEVLTRIRNEVPKGKASVPLRDLLNMHTVRMLTTDLPAMICFAIAAVRALRVA